MLYDTQKIKVYGQWLRQYNTIPIVENTVNFLKFQFIFSEEWANKPKTAVFEFDGQSYMKILVNDTCYVPHEVIHLPLFSVTVFASHNGQVIRTAGLRFRVMPSGNIAPQEAVDPSPDVYQQLLDLYQSQHLIAGDGIVIDDDNRISVNIIADYQAEQEGQQGKIYIDKDEHVIYRWDGSQYVILANDWHNIEVIDSDSLYY